MYVHVDPELLERKPWIGVLIGLVGVVVFGLMFGAFRGERRRLSSQQAPEEVTPATAALTDARPRRWVRLSGGRWDCARSLVERRRVPERWLFGDVEAVYVPVVDERGHRVLVLKFDKAVECTAISGEPVMGMLVRPGDSIWGGGVPKAALGFDPAVVVTVGDGPAAARQAEWGSLGFLVAMTAFAGVYLKKWQAQREAPANRP